MIALAFVAGGCTPGQAPPLKLGINRWPTCDLLWVADQKGYFRELGVDVRLEQFPGFSDSFQALQKGKLDLACVTSAELAQSSVPLAPIRVLDESAGLDGIVGGPKVHTLADLQGKRVGLEPEGEIVLHAALQSVGLGVTSIDFVLLSQAIGEEMLASGMIDAIVTYPPVLGRVERMPGSTRLFDTSQTPDLVYDFIAAPRPVAQQRTKELDLLARGYDRALQLLRERPDEVHAMIARRYRLTPAEAAAWFQDGVRIHSAAEQAALLATNGPVARSLDQARTAVAKFAIDGR